MSREIHIVFPEPPEDGMDIDYDRAPDYLARVGDTLVHKFEYTDFDGAPPRDEYKVTFSDPSAVDQQERKDVGRRILAMIGLQHTVTDSWVVLKVGNYVMTCKKTKGGDDVFKTSFPLRVIEAQ